MGNLELEVKDYIAKIKFSNPPVNALSSRILNELSDLLYSLEDNRDVRVLLIYHDDKFFSAGADIKEFLAIETSEEASNASSNGQELFERIENFPKPIIAVLNGSAFGGGLEFVMSCHLRLASNKASFGLTEINLGIIPGFAGTQRLTRHVGVAKACEMMLTGLPISCEEALRCGLINQIYAEDNLFEEAYKFAKRISNQSPEAVKAILSLAYANKNVPFQRAVVRESQLFGEVFCSNNAKEGIAAFLEKRTPIFLNN